MYRNGLRAVALVLGLVLTCGAASAASSPPIYVFGDSLSDAGNDHVLSLGTLPSWPYSHGRFTNGPLWVQDLAPKIGFAGVRASLDGGTDFAYGGAESGTTRVHKLVPIDLPGQLLEFTATVPTPNPNGLFVLWIGANDLIDILSDTKLTEKQVTEAVGQVVANEVSFVEALVLLGARNLLVVTSPDLGVTPAVTGQGPVASAAASALSKAYNALLFEEMTTLASLSTLHLTFLDTFALIDGAVADPAQYGFKNVIAPCWTGGYTEDDGTLCATSVAGQNRYLFWDGLHPTAKGHKLVAAAAEAALNPAPALASSSQ